jgi:hypothetical protein
MKRNIQIKNRPIKEGRKKEEDPKDYLEDEEREEDEELEGQKDRPVDDEDQDEEAELAEYEAARNKRRVLFIGIGVAVVLIVIIFFMIKGGGGSKKPTVAPVQTPVSTAQNGKSVDPVQQQKDALYKNGIGKEYVSQQNIFDQGPIEANKFRKDFLNNDAPETYKRPLKVVTVNDSVSYVKHRTITDDGIDLYWVDATYKGKKTQFTISYYIYQALSPQGVMDVQVETVTDADGHVYITSMAALPPAQTNQQK